MLRLRAFLRDTGRTSEDGGVVPSTRPMSGGGKKSQFFLGRLDDPL